VVELASDLLDGGKHCNVSRALGKGLDVQHGLVGCEFPEERLGIHQNSIVLISAHELGKTNYHNLGS
jgi:hypothetical protein